MPKSCQMVLTDKGNEPGTRVFCQGRSLHPRGRNWSPRPCVDFPASPPCLRWQILAERLLCLIHQRKNILSPSSTVYVRMTVCIHPPFRKIPACEAHVISSSPSLSIFSFMMKLYRFRLFNVCSVPGPGINAVGTLVGNSSSGSTGLEGVSRGFIWLSMKKAFLFLTKGSGPFCSSEFMNELVSWYEARFSYSLETKIIQNSSVKKQDLLGVV